MSSFEHLPIDAIPKAMLRDQFWLRSQRKRLLAAEQQGRDQSAQRQRWIERLQGSVELRESRARAMPQPELDNELPIAMRVEEISGAIRDHQVVVISGETGSGKSTQLPLICLQLGLGISGFIGHTQPRRIAARGVASRVAEQLGRRLGETVGYKIRFGDQTGPQTLVKVMTDGMLLAETGADRFLNQYEVIIIDEAHERSLNIDFLLGYLRRLLPKRPELKLIITSATIDTAKFAEHFSTPERPVPVIDVEGRTWPVDIQYRTPGRDDRGNEVEQNLEDATVEAVRDLAGSDRGDMLVFLPTEQAIRSLAKKLRSRPLPGDGNRPSEIQPLYARLSNEQQNSIFKPGAARRIVLATNVAESSITVPRIRYVVDQGLARISRYAPRSKVQRLPIESVSQASADQRAGRCGRIGPGVCVRLFSEEDYLQRPRYTTPEIRRTNLASVILQTEAMHLGAIGDFPFIDPPGIDAIRDGYKTLHEIGAVDPAKKLTRLGKQLSRLPVDPRLGRMIFAASDNGCLLDVLVITAALEIQDPRVRPAEHQAVADQTHRQWKDEQSDFVSLLNLWDWIHQQREALSNSQFRKACARNFLSFMLVQQWLDVHRQLKSLCRDHRLHLAGDRDNYATIHQSLLAGLLSGVAMQTDGREYMGAGGIKFRIWPGSGVVKGKSKPAWILAAEIVETGQRYGRTVAKIDPDWIEPLADHIVRRNYSEPHWSKKRQSATAYEKVSLFGLPIVPRRPVRYGPIDPDHSRQLLIEKGLVEDQMRTDPPFLVHNRGVLEEIETLAAKTRQRDFVIDDYAVRNFYASRLPADAVDGATLAGLIKQDRPLDHRLRFSVSDLTDPESSGVSAEDFPETLEIGEIRLPVKYNFTPGTDDDGVNVQVPPEAVSQIHDNHLGWSVPGLLQPRIIALIRSLPKAVRRNLVPAPDTAEKIAGEIEFGVGSFWNVIAEHLSRVANEPITTDMFRLEKLDDSLKINLQVRDDAGQVIAQGRSLYQLKSQLPEASAAQPVELPDDNTWHRDELRNWDWDEFPEQIVRRRGAADVPLFPTIIDQGEQVQLRLLDNRAVSQLATRQGLATLFRIAHRKLIGSQVNWLPLDPLMRAAFEKSNAECPAVSPVTGLPHCRQGLDDQLAQLISLIAFVDDSAVPRNRQEFDDRGDNAAEKIGLATQNMAGWFPQLLELHHRVSLQLQQLPGSLKHAADDIQKQMRFLFGREPLSAISAARVEHYPRYLQAILLRLDRLQSGSLEKDRQQTQELQQYVERYEAALAARAQVGEVDSHLEQFGWMIQEYRVSLFAQKLGTNETVSPQRLDRQWRKVGTPE